MILGRIGWTAVASGGEPPPDEEWYDVGEIPLSAGGDETAANKTLRVRIAPPALGEIGGERLRFRLRGPAAGNPTVIGEMWAGKIARGASGTPLANAVRLRVGGSPAAVIPVAGSIFTDGFDLIVDPETEDLVFSAYLTSVTQNLRMISPTVAGVTGQTSGGNQATATASLGAGLGASYIVDLVQSNAPFTPVSDPNTLRFDDGAFTPPAGNAVNPTFGA